MKKFLVLLAAVLSVCFMQGCDSKQLNERMVIQGIGIDYSDSRYSVTVMYMNTDAANPDIAYKTVAGKGKTVTEAVATIVTKNGMDPLYSHNSFILLGNGLCKQGVEEAMEFFAGFYQCRPSVNVIAADRQANKIMTLKGITPHTISNIVNSKHTTGRTLAVPVYEFLSDIINDTTTACTGVITVENNVPRSGGIALFKHDRMYKVLDKEQSMGVMLVRGDTDIDAEVISLTGKNKSFTLSQEKTEITVKISRGVLYCDISIKGEASVYEYTNQNKEQEKSIEKRLNELAEKAVRVCADSGADVFNLGKRLRQSDYSAYRTIDNWTELVKKGVYTVKSRVNI